jgi:alcohol dehydrogenase
VRAIRATDSGLILDTAAPAPTLSPGEGLVRPTLLGVARADIDIARGRSAFRGIIGHEFVGILEDLLPAPDATPATLDRVSKLRGKRVVGSMTVACGRCDMCKAGLPTHCRQRAMMGIMGRDGCFAERFAIPLSNLHAVPDAIPDEQAVFAEPLAAAAHARSMFRVEGKPFITVLGDGRMGLLTVQVMARLNASVRLLGRHPEKFGLCERWSIKHRHIDEVGRRQDQDVVVDCTGTPEGLELAMALVRPRGKIILRTAASTPATPASPGAPASASPWARPVDLSPLVHNEVDLIGAHAGSIAEALTILTRKDVLVEPLITRKVRPENAIEAISMPGAIKTLITM